MERLFSPKSFDFSTEFVCGLCFENPLTLCHVCLLKKKYKIQEDKHLKWLKQPYHSGP